MTRCVCGHDRALHSFRKLRWFRWRDGRCHLCPSCHEYRPA